LIGAAIYLSVRKGIAAPIADRFADKPAAQ